MNSLSTYLSQCVANREVLLCPSPGTDDLFRRSLEEAIQRSVGCVEMAEALARMQGERQRPFLLIEANRLRDVDFIGTLANSGLRYEADWLAVSN